MYRKEIKRRQKFNVLYFSVKYNIQAAFKKAA